MLRFLLTAQHAGDFLAEDSIAFLRALLFLAMTFQALVQCLQRLNDLRRGNLGLLRLRLGLRGRHGGDSGNDILRPGRSETKGVRATYDEPVRLLSSEGPTE